MGSTLMGARLTSVDRGYEPVDWRKPAATCRAMGPVTTSSQVHAGLIVPVSLGVDISTLPVRFIIDWPGAIQVLLSTNLPSDTCVNDDTPAHFP